MQKTSSPIKNFFIALSIAIAVGFIDQVLGVFTFFAVGLFLSRHESVADVSDMEVCNPYLNSPIHSDLPSNRYHDL